MNLQEVNNITITEGTVRTIHDSNNRLLWGKLNYDTKYAGDTVQDGTPTPDSPVVVDVVTGSQTITISDGTNTGSFTVNLGTTELCKIGDYQDYIYKSGDNWYLHKAVDKAELGSLTWQAGSTNQTGLYRMYSGDLNGMFVTPAENNIPVEAFCSHFVAVRNDSAGTYGCNIGLSVAKTGDNVFIYDTDYNQTTSVSNFKTWLQNNNVVFYYALAEPTDTQITDATLIRQLNSIHQFLTRYGYSSTVTGNLPIIIEQTNL